MPERTVYMFANFTGTEDSWLKYLHIKRTYTGLTFLKMSNQKHFVKLHRNKNVSTLLYWCGEFMKWPDNIELLGKNFWATLLPNKMFFFKYPTLVNTLVFYFISFVTECPHYFLPVVSTRYTRNISLCTFVIMAKR